MTLNLVWKNYKYLSNGVVRGDPLLVQHLDTMLKFVTIFLWFRLQ